MILVVGPGAVGGYFGGRLVAAGETVVFFCRPKTKTLIEKNGLHIESVSGNIDVRPRCVDRAEDIGAADLILWAVKTYDNPSLIPQIQSCLADSALVLSLQNGVDAVDELAAAFGQSRVLGGFAGIASEVIEPGRIRHTALGRITLGEPDGSESARVLSTARLLDRAGIPHRVSRNIRRDLWAKLVWNAAFNPVSVFFQTTVEHLLADISSLSILKRAMTEVLRVAAAEGYPLPEEILEKYLDPAEQRGEFYTSMLQDFRRGKPMESESISGAVVRRARSRGIPAPVNELFFDCLTFWNRSRGS